MATPEPELMVAVPISLALKLEQACHRRVLAWTAEILDSIKGQTTGLEKHQRHDRQKAEDLAAQIRLRITLAKALVYQRRPDPDPAESDRSVLYAKLVELQHEGVRLRDMRMALEARLKELDPSLRPAPEGDG